MPQGGWRLAYAAVLCASVIAPGSIAPTPVAAGIPDQTNVAVPRDTTASASIRIDPGAKTNGYTTPNVTMAQGGTLTVVNFDGDFTHSVTSKEKDANGNALFTVDVGP